MKEKKRFILPAEERRSAPWHLSLPLTCTEIPSHLEVHPAPSHAAAQGCHWLAVTSQGTTEAHQEMSALPTLW